MKDEKLKLRGLHVSHTLGCSGDEVNRRDVCEFESRVLPTFTTPEDEKKSGQFPDDLVRVKGIFTTINS
jgi:hypothetical protein